MTSVLLAIHLIIVLAIIVLVLLQRSEGGGLGMGGGGSSNSFMSARGTANVMSRATAILAGAFFVTSLLLAYFATQSAPKPAVIDRPASSAPVTPATPAAPSQGGILDTLRNQQQAPRQ